MGDMAWGAPIVAVAASVIFDVAPGDPIDAGALAIYLKTAGEIKNGSWRKERNSIGGRNTKVIVQAIKVMSHDF